MLSYEKIIEETISWARREENIRALSIIGSRARNCYPADDWSDLDLIIIARDPKVYIEDTRWVKVIAESKITFLEGTAVGNEIEVRVLFDGGLDVDFAVIPEMILRENATIFAGIVVRGIKVLLDKDGILSRIDLSNIEIKNKPPSNFEFTNSIKDFWYHSVWTAKKLLRGELWTAKACCDIYMKNILLKMIEWRSLSKNGWDYDVWHKGRFLERWADPCIIDGLKRTYAHYDREDIERALLETMDLFRWIAVETAKRLEYEYPDAEDRYARELVKKLFTS